MTSRDDIYTKLDEFRIEHEIFSKGRLAAIVQLTRMCSEREYPYDPECFKTEQQGQVAGLSGTRIKKILREYGITKSLASEGGRTSRGNMSLAKDYLHLLNEMHEQGRCDFGNIELYWIQQVRFFLEAKPLNLISEPGMTVSASLENLFQQTSKRQTQNPGTQYSGKVLQHLVGAKLAYILPEKTFEHHGSDVADAPTGRAGDFVISKTVIHCTTAPSTPLIEKCAVNIQSGYHPIIVTTQDRTNMAIQLVDDEGLSGKVDVWAIQQFLSSNINERSLFDDAYKEKVFSEIIEEYNAIVEKTETDPSLKISFGSYACGRVYSTSAL